MELDYFIVDFWVFIVGFRVFIVGFKTFIVDFLVFLVDFQWFIVDSTPSLPETKLLEFEGLPFSLFIFR